MRTMGSPNSGELPTMATQVQARDAGRGQAATPMTRSRPIRTICTRKNRPKMLVPAPVEHDDLAGGRQVRHVALEVPLGALPLRGGAQGDDAGAAGVEALGDALDGAPLAGGVTPLEDDDHALSARPDPVLELDKLGLEALELVLVVGGGEAARLGEAGGLGGAEIAHGTAWKRGMSMLRVSY